MNNFLDWLFLVQEIDEIYKIEHIEFSTVEKKFLHDSFKDYLCVQCLFYDRWCFHISAINWGNHHKIHYSKGNDYVNEYEP